MKKLASLLIAITLAITAAAPAMACYKMNCNGPSTHQGN